MRIIATDRAPIPRGHYSQAIVHGDTVYVAGQLPIDPDTGRVVGDTPREQTIRTLRNVEAILTAAGSGLQHLLSLTIYVTDERHWDGVNTAVAEVLGSHKPARAVIPTPPLRGGALVEIQGIAALGAD